jgi:hypothetical protein
MTIEEYTREAFDHYATLITKARPGIEAKNDAENGPPPWSDPLCVLPDAQRWLPHALWMCRTMYKEMKQTHISLDKASRWLGFVQAVVILSGLTTVKEERDLTRPWFRRPPIE